VLTLLAALQMLSDAVEMHGKPALFYECFTGAWPLMTGVTGDLGFWT